MGSAGGRLIAAEALALPLVVKIPPTCNDLQLLHMIMAHIYLKAFSRANKIIK